MKRSTRLVFAVLLLVMSVILNAVADDFKPYPVPLKGKKIAIFLDQQYQVREAFYAPRRFSEAGADVKIVSHTLPYVERYRPTYTHRMKTDITFEEALKIKWDGLLVIGGFCPLETREDKTVIDIIHETNRRGGMCAAVCHGVTVFVTADILRGKNCTGNVPRAIEFSNAGGIFHEEAPQVDGNLITAISGGDNGPFVDSMINWFQGGEQVAKAHMNDQYLKGKKVAIVLDNRYKYSHVYYPYTRLRQNGASVYIIANTIGEFREYKNVHGTTKADMSAQDATNERFDAIILVSHYAADTYRRHADVRQFVTSQFQRGTLVASIDWGHTTFIQADIARGYEFACTWGMQNDIRNAGGAPMLKPVHRDRNLITCATEDDMPELMRYVVGYLTTVK